MSSYASLTGARANGVFDSLLVRNPPVVGPFVSVLGGGGGSADLSAVEADISALQNSVAARRRTSDSYSRIEVSGFLAARYTKTEADGLLDAKASASEVSDSLADLQVAVDDKVASSRVLTDVPADAKFTDKDTLYTHPTAHSIGFITGLQGALDEKVSSSRVLTDVPAGALFRDTVYTPPHSRPISYITDLQGQLDTKAGQSATTVALSHKVDKTGSISASESNANLLARVQYARSCFRLVHGHAI